LPVDLIYNLIIHLPLLSLNLLCRHSRYSMF